MNAKSQTLLASTVEVAIGAWVMLVPVFTSLTGGALVSTLITGGAIALAGLLQLVWENVIPSWVDGLLAIWLFVSAYVFTVSTAVTWNLVLAAIAAFLVALWDGVEVSEVRQSHRRHA